ncbi:MAG: glycoside hydrolase family 31 protein [Clostridia bacterium]|nr:glycoside hydrolase family 31 protein [Clostridia bacterium]
MPVLHSTNGYFLFVNSMYGGWFDFGKTTPYVYSLEFNGPVTDLYVFVGTPKENLKAYTDLTGHSIIPPKWVHQYWIGGGAPQWKDPGPEPKDPDYYQIALRNYINGYAEMGIHHIAACYGEGGPSLNKAGYDIAAEHGIRMLIWNHPSVSWDLAKKVLGTENMFELPQLTTKQGKYIKIETGAPWVDFTNPNTKTVIRERYKQYFDWGLKGAMIDFGEFVTPDALLYNGKDGNAMHNEHSYWYAKTMKEIFEERLGDDYILFERSACAGSQKFVANFGGDQAARFYGLKQAYYAGLTIGASGFNIWGSDIGGYNGGGDRASEPDMYMRWLEFATFSPIMRSHGTGKERNPWAYGEVAVELFKRLYWWRENMLDYIYSNAINAHYTAEPMMRVMAIEFPGEDVAKVDTQYMFGSERLVAPVIDEGRRCKMVVFPKGNWVNLWTRENYAGDRRVMVTAQDDEIPVYLRPGAAMVLNLTESLEICENMEDKKVVKALLTTPADAKREVKHYVDADTAYTFITDKVANEAVTVTNQDGFKLDAVLVYGMEATKVLVDGKETTFTAENNNTVVNTPNGFNTVQVF